MSQEQNVGSGEDKNPVQQSSMAHGVLNTDVFIQEITSTIEVKLRNEIQSLINEHKSQREESDAKIDELTRKNEESWKRVDELTRKNEESDAKIDELTRKNEESLKRVDNLIRQNEELCADYRKVMAQFNSAQCRIDDQNRLLIRSVTGKMKLHHCCLTS